MNRRYFYLGWITIWVLSSGVASCKSPFLETSKSKKETTLAIDPSIFKEHRWRHKALTTQFYVGENGVDVSAFNMKWKEYFGGVDDPLNRKPDNVYFPNLPEIKQNPFYFALPYSDVLSSGEPKEDRKKIPWFDPNSTEKSQIKNRWIKIEYKGQACYGQWQDCGPVNSNHLTCDDYDYVFGRKEKPSHDQFALDISPALSYCLGMRGPGNEHFNDETSWQFVSFEEVPEGPWKEVVTSTDAVWF